MDLTRDPRFESTFYDEPNSSSGGTLFCWKFIDRQGPEYYYDNTYHGGPIRRRTCACWTYLSKY